MPVHAVERAIAEDRLVELSTEDFPQGGVIAGSVVDAENEPRILQIAALPMQEALIVGNTYLASTASWSLSIARRSQAGKITNILRPKKLSGHYGI